MGYACSGCWSIYWVSGLWELERNEERGLSLKRFFGTEVEKLVMMDG